jgi:hypothetical protein
MEADIKRIPDVLAEVRRLRTGDETTDAPTPPPDNNEPPKQLSLF